MAQEYLSLREIGRRLNIPPSSVVYYKDRFARFIPKHGSGGRRTRYPAEALSVFREIREMYNRNWSSEQIEERLEAALRNAESAGVDADAMSGANPSANVIDRVAGLLESHALFRAEIDTLRNEMQALRTEKERAEKRHHRQLEQLEQEVRTLRAERDRLFRRMEQNADAADAPPRALLALPLVIAKDGEFLGVAGRRGHFSLDDFVALIERRRRQAGAAAAVTMGWTRRGGGWRLTVRLPEGGQGREHELDVVETTTPSGNRVARLARMAVDGQAVPDRYLLLLFRGIREEFEV